MRSLARGLTSTWMTTPLRRGSWALRKADLYKVEAKVGMGVWKYSREAGAARNGEFRTVTREGQLKPGLLLPLV